MAERRRSGRVGVLENGPEVWQVRITRLAS